MKITECQILFTDMLSFTRIASPKNTHNNKIAALILEMARAYESDGITFFVSGDPVNALASFYYGLGWLHFGLASGLLMITHTHPCPFWEPLELLQPPHKVKLEKKACRYAYLLETALSSVRYAPDPATASYGFAERIHFIASMYARHGENHLKSSSPEDALADFSYGHGWLDAGVTAGLFRIDGARELFCV